MTLLDQGTLPKQPVDVLLNAGETCHFGAYSVLFEPGKVRRNDMTMTPCERLTAAALYITDTRILFVGSSATHFARFSSLARAFTDNGALVIQRATGKNQHFVFNNGLDLETAVRILQHLCGAKKLSPSSDKLTASSKPPPCQEKP